MNINFLGAAHEVTGSCTLISACGKKFLVDCGMEQGGDIYENQELPVYPYEIDFVLLTHAHIDHSGKIPMLTANGFKGQIYATEATTKLCTIMLLDSAHIQEFEAKWKNRKAARAGMNPYVPIYTIDDVKKTMPMFVSCSYHNSYEICDGIEIKFIDAGHLLGSSSIEIKITENGTTKTLLFSGDIGNINRPLIRNPEKPSCADYVIIESTYGNRLHGERPDYVTQLTEIIQRTLDRGGNLVIPCFAIGRTQEMLYLIREIKEKNLVKNHANFPVYVDSPLAVEATNIYNSGMTDYYDEETLKLLEKGINPITFEGLKLSITSDDSVRINIDKSPKVILSASGMCEAGRIRHHLKHNLWRSESTILFVGYQAEGTLGNAIINGRNEVRLFGEPIKVNAEIAQIDGISGHADMNMLLDWLKNIKEKPSKVFINHGNDVVCDEFAYTIRNELDIDAVAPFPGAMYDLLSGICISPGSRKKIEKKDNHKKGVTTSAFAKLLAAGKRMLAVIDKCRGYSNKDLAKFESQLTNLCDKWDD